jgi:hypothetical protein
VIAVWLALLAGRPGITAPTVGRVVTTPTLHVGVRGAVLVTPEERAVGVTIQVTAF